MIKINLAKSDKKKSAGVAFSGSVGSGGGDSFQGDVDSQKVGARNLLIVFAFPAALYLYEMQLIPELQATLGARKQQLQSLTEKNEKAKGAVEETKKFKEDQSKLQKQIGTLENLRRERLKEVKVMDNLQKDIPEKVWLTRIDFQEQKLNLSGLATADIELTSFMENLQRSVFLREVNLVRSSEQPSESGVLKKFDISCAVELDKKNNDLSAAPGPGVTK